MATPTYWTAWGGPRGRKRLGQAASQIQNAFTPWAPPPIPAGYYDPNLDAQRQAASRGLLNTQQDVGLGERRAGEDLGNTQFDINTGYDRGIADINTQRQYTTEDYTRNVDLLKRQFSQLANQQGQQARKYGVTSGGIALLAAAKRSANQGIEQQTLDTGRDRALAGYDTQASRLGQDKTTQLSRAQQGYDRGIADFGTTLGRAQGEDTFFGLDTDAQKLYQAQQAGYVAPTGPANEFTRPDGTVVHTVRRGGYTYVYDRTGKLLQRRRAG